MARYPVRAAVAAIVALAVAVAGCASTPPPGLAPTDAAATLGRTLDLDQDQVTCLQGRFEDAPGAANALDPDQPPSDDDRDAFLTVIRGCVPPEAFGTTLAATVRDEIPEATDAQAACVHDNVIALPAPEQDRLYLYFANPALVDVADIGPAADDLLASCDLLAAATTVPTPDGAGGAGDATSTEPPTTATTS